MSSSAEEGAAGQPTVEDAGAWAPTQQFQAGHVHHAAAEPPAVVIGKGERGTSALIGRTLGHFRVVALIGQGGMGHVYRAVDEHLHREVALKVLPPNIAADPDHRRRLVHEARAAAAVTHKNIAGVYEVGQDNDRLFIAMELVEGETLRHRMASGITLDLAIDLATQMARGVARAHEKGVIHRDLKPDNVIVTNDGDVKILDFGLAKRLRARDEPHLPKTKDDAPIGATRAGFISGTPGYMSPEQVLGEHLDYRSDIFSFGVVLYEMATGVQPFRGTIDEIFRATLSKSPLPPTEINPSISPELESVILRCMARWPLERIGSARELVTELELAARSRRSQAGVVLPSADVTIRTTRAPVSSLFAPAKDLPSGTITLLCAYLAEAAQLHQRYGERYVDILARFHELLGQSTSKSGGFVVEFAGEQAIAAFTEAPNALQTAVLAQRGFHSEAWPEGASVRVRIGLHTGEPKLVGDRYVGLETHRAMRVGEAAPGGQIVLTAATRELLRPEDLSGLLLQDLGALRIKDLHYPERLFEVSIDSLPEPLSVIHRLSGAWNKLPQQGTAFIGRAKEIAAVIALLRRPDTRICTLTGPGGTGKTRLSLEVARSLSRDFPDGVVQVLLGSVQDPALVPASVAQALEVVEVVGKPLLEVIKNRIGQSRLLLVLDNFEQIVDAAPMVVDLCSACPSLKVLVTSREVLKVSSEREYSVPPLEVPPEGGEISLDAALASEAVQLFVERARAASPSFAINAESAPLLCAVCARLEGIPLAIELAASRMKMLTLPALHKRLSDRFGILKGSDRDRAQRHQTLRAAIDWSYNLLDDAHKALLCRTSVFAGGFFIESAEVVCAGDELGVDTFEGLSSLVDKSLLTKRDVDGEPRLGALETIREYAAEHLKKAPDEAEIRARHAEHFTALAEAMEPGVSGRDWRRSAGTLTREADNIRAALVFALEQPTPALTGRLLRALLWFWVLHGRLQEGQTWAARALEQTAAHPRSPERAVTLYVAGWLCLFAGDIASVLTYSTEGAALWKDLGREAEVLRTRLLLGLSTAAAVEFGDGFRMLEETRDACRGRKDTFGAAVALNFLGELARATGDYEQARVTNEEAVRMLQGAGFIMMSSLLSINLAYAYLHSSDWARAAKVAVETLDLGLETNNPLKTAYSLGIMAGVAVVRGQHAEGLRLFGALGSILKSLGATVQPGDQAEFDRYTDIAKVALGEGAAAAALEEGAGWSRDRAIRATIPLRA